MGFNLRSSVAVQQAKEIVGGEDFGNPLMAVFRYGLCSGRTMYDVVMDQHCHLIDLARFLLDEVKTANVVQSRLPNARDYVVALTFESGVVGTLNFTSGQIPEKEFIYFEITGVGTFLYSHGCSSLRWYRPTEDAWWKAQHPDYVWERGMYGGLVMLEALGYVNDVANYIAAVKGEAEDCSPISSSIGTMELCEEIVHQMEME